MSNTEQLVVTSGKALREGREKGTVLPFPSGHNYRVRIPGADGLLKRGNLPNPLLRFVVDAFYQGVTEEKYQAFLSPQESGDSARELIESLRAVCEAMFMEPRVVETPEADDELTAADLPLMDRMWAFRLAFAPAEVLYPFRGEQTTPVESVPQTQDSTQAAE